jgi:uncharacterized protein YukJ
MPIARYGLLIGRPLHGVPGRGANAHYQIHVVDDVTEYRIAVNVKSQLAPSEVEYLVDDDFRHPLTATLRDQAPGFYRLGYRPADGGLDYIRGNLFDRTKMRPLPMNLPGPDDDLNDHVDRVVQAAMAEEDALVYAFGQRWGPEDDARDKIFGFLPGNGIHDIHMNQGNSGRFVDDDGVWQDGGLLFYFPSVDRWTAVFLKFPSSSRRAGTPTTSPDTRSRRPRLRICRRTSQSRQASRICGFASWPPSSIRVAPIRGSRR